MITVVNKRDDLYLDENGQDEPFKVYIGRPSPLGNPYSTRGSKFSVAVCATIAECITRFEADLNAAMKSMLGTEEQEAMRDEMHRLVELHEKHGQLVLECWCKPKACHGDVIKQHLEKMLP